MSLSVVAFTSSCLILVRTLCVRFRCSRFEEKRVAEVEDQSRRVASLFEADNVQPFRLGKSHLS